MRELSLSCDVCIDAEETEGPIVMRTKNAHFNVAPRTLSRACSVSGNVHETTSCGQLRSHSR